MVLAFISFLIFACVPNIFQVAFAENSDPGPLAPLQEALEKKTSKLDTVNQAPAAAPSMSGGDGKMDMMEIMSQMMGQMMPPMAPSKMNSDTNMQSSSELPGFPGASHIYHIGAKGFFIEHASMAKMTTGQIMLLNKLKEKSLLENSAVTREIQQFEEDLWTLTAADQPVIKSIEAKVREISDLKSKQRISFISHIGEAAKILTAEQRSILLGQAPKTSMPPGDM